MGLFLQEVNYNGYKRNIISFNPPLVDDEGDIIEDEDEIEEGEASPLEDNIYEEIKLEGPLIDKDRSRMPIADRDQISSAL